MWTTSELFFYRQDLPTCFIGYWGCFCRHAKAGWHKIPGNSSVLWNPTQIFHICYTLNHSVILSTVHETQSEEMCLCCRPFGLLFICYRLLLWLLLFQRLSNRSIRWDRNCTSRAARGSNPPSCFWFQSSPGAESDVGPHPGLFLITTRPRWKFDLRKPWLQQLQPPLDFPHSYATKTAATQSDKSLWRPQM